MPLMVTPSALRRRSGFYREAATLVAAGVPLLRALRTIRDRPPDRSYRAPLDHIQRSIESGASLTESLASLRGWLPLFDQALLRAGEESGRLVECFRFLAEHYAEQARLLSTLLAALIYPMVLLHLAVLIFPTETLTRLVLQGAWVSFLAQKLALLLPLYCVFGFIAYALQGGRSRWWRSGVEVVLSAVPVLGGARRDLALARLAAALEALISAGVTVIEAWEVASAASGSPALQRRVDSWVPRWRAGETPGEVLATARGVPDFFASLYRTGETSGGLDEELRHLHGYYVESATRKLRMVVYGLSGLVYVAVMLLVAWRVIAFWLGYFRQINEIMQ
jgi:type II secretory pathway component PulF